MAKKKTWVVIFLVLLLALVVRFIFSPSVHVESVKTNYIGKEYIISISTTKDTTNRQLELQQAIIKEIGKKAKLELVPTDNSLSYSFDLIQKKLVDIVMCPTSELRNIPEDIEKTPSFHSNQYTLVTFKKHNPSLMKKLTEAIEKMEKAQPAEE